MILTKPVIGLTPLYDTEQNRLWMRPNYLRAIDEAGGVPLVLPLIQEKADISALAKRCDGFLFTGGPDVHPMLYGEETMQYCGAIDRRRDTLEILLLQEAIRLGKPVFGICRGIQLINVALGGSLYQDIPAQVASEPIAHDQKPPYDVPVHSVVVEPESLLYDIVQKTKMVVDSMHHQAVKELAPPLRCAARSKDDVVECVYMPGKRFFLAVQWHPEYMFEQDGDSRRIFEAFLSSARE